jgi:SP family arabinose:H+ symporter-like MFS transporter
VIEAKTAQRASGRARPAYMLLVSLVAALGGMMFGFDIAIISGAAPFVQEHFQLNELQLGWGVSSLLAGCMLGAMFAGRLADALGRKRTLVSIALVFAFTSVLTAIAPAFSWFVAARIVGGLAVGAASMVSPLYIAEVSPYAMRGRMVALNQLAITTGILVSYLINYLLRGAGPDNWRWMFASGVIPSVLFFGLLFLVPESPRWLFHAGKRAEASAVLVRVGGVENAEKEISEMQQPAKEEAASLRDLLLPRYRRVLLVGVVLAILVQISGINTVIDYAPIILRSAGNTIGVALFQTFIMGFLNFGLTFVAIFTVDRVGRRPLYIAGATGMTISLTLLSAGFLVGKVQGLVGLILILLFIASFAGCIGPVFWILMSEIFPSRIRGLAMSAAVFTNWLANFLVVLFFPWMFKNTGGSATFGFLAVMALAMILFTWKVVPETSGRTLEEIELHWEARTP